MREEKKKVIKDMVSDLEKKGHAHRKIKNEHIVAKRVKLPGGAFDKVGIFSYPVVNSKEDLLVYVKRAHKRLNRLPKNLENVAATITFNKPQNEPRIKEIISKHRLKGRGVKLEGSHGFKTMARYPIDKNHLKDVRAGIIESYNEAKKLAASTSDPEKKQILEQALQKDFVETFEIDKGVFALYCLGKSDDLINCKNEKETHIVDIGAREVKDYVSQLKSDLPQEIQVVPPGDLAYFVREFLD